jgi:hypothetical protein
MHWPPQATVTSNSSLCLCHLNCLPAQAFEQNMSKRSSSGGDAKWLQQVRRSGTTSDKVAAMSVLVQDGAVANLHSLDGLLAMCSKKGGECISCRSCIAQASEREQPARCGAVCRQAAAACCLPA